MTNAALYLHPDAIDTTGARILGRQAAGESFLRGFLRHAEVDRFHLWSAAGGVERLQPLVTRIQPPPKPVTWIPATGRPAFREPGVVHIPGPALGGEAWARRIYGQGAYSLSGLTHTTSTRRIMDMLSDLLVAPVDGHDALICTSSAVRAAVEAQLDGVRDYLTGEYGPRRRAEPQRVTIPLGVNADDFAPTSEQRQAWRRRLEIPDEAFVALYVGRFNAREKMNPALMAIALQKAAEATGAELYWVNAGWAETPDEEARYHQAQALCPSVRYRPVDGRDAAARFSIWSVADSFISFSDNIQETFGLTPVEAMAAGLPCVVTDWNGYRDTVRHGEDGFRIPTVAPSPGDGVDLAYWYANDWTSYTDYVGAAAQFTAIDFAESTAAISALVANPDLRRRLGRQAQARARETFDWSAIVPQYQALWGELNARRRSGRHDGPVRDNPFRPDPFRLFAGYPSRHLTGDWGVSLAADFDLDAAEALLTGPVAGYSAFNHPTAEERRLLFARLAERPGAAIAEVMELFPAERRPAIQRALLWIARYGVIVLQPPDPAPSPRP